MNLIEYAKMEFKAINGNSQEDEWMQKNLIELLTVFSKQGHSGFSAKYCIDAFSKLVWFDPLTPLTGEDWEWSQVGTNNTWQNIRCSHVFKDEHGHAWDINEQVVHDEKNNTYSRPNITFPYIPKPY